MAATVKVKLVRSPIGSSHRQREHLRGLGLRKVNDERELNDTPSVRGLIAHVNHLVSVSAGAPPAPKRARKPKAAAARE